MQSKYLYDQARSNRIDDEAGKLTVDIIVNIVSSTLASVLPLPSLLIGPSLITPVWFLVAIKASQSVYFDYYLVCFNEQCQNKVFTSSLSLDCERCASLWGKATRSISLEL